MKTLRVGYRRSNKASKTDDIATYGEVIRLGDKFITLDPSTHKLTLPASLALTNGAYALTTAEDFAKLAITWQTNGYYSGTVKILSQIDRGGLGPALL